MHLAPHLLLRTDSVSSGVAAKLGAAGYLISKIDDDDLAARIAGANHIDGVIIELSALAAIHLCRKLEARYGAGNLVVVVITPAADSVRNATSSTAVLTPFEIADDLVTTVDLAIAARQMRMTG